MEPIVIEAQLEVAPQHAFEVWTEKCSIWWPPSHSMGEGQGFEVVFEPFQGGRIFERGQDGAEHDWGQVTTWEPPSRLEYRWHIFLSPEQATIVTVEFQPTDTGTKVRLVNSGFEVFDEATARDRVGRVQGAWESLIELYRGAV